MALTKAHLANKVARELEVQLSVAKDLVDSFFDELKDELDNSGVIKISGFGNFTVREKSARPGRNPKTGAIVSIKARRVVTFRAGQKLKLMVSD